jgi:hypothetical protein
MIVELKVRTSESGHWYTQEGKPAYTTVGSNGKVRNTTLRDAKKLNLLPSVTTVMSVAAKPGLEAWKQQQLLLASLTLPKDENESLENYAKRILEDSRQQARDAADRGTAIHAEIQAFYEGDLKKMNIPYVRKVIGAIQSHFGDRTWISEASFAAPHGYGGKVDLHCHDTVIDIKTKEFSPDDKITLFDEHYMQLAAYSVGLKIHPPRCANVFVSTIDPYPVIVLEHEPQDIQRGWEMFLALLSFWKAKSKTGG